MTPVTAGNTNPVTLISYSFVCLGLYTHTPHRRPSMIQAFQGRIHDEWRSTVEDLGKDRQTGSLVKPSRGGTTRRPEQLRIYIVTFQTGPQPNFLYFHTINLQENLAK